MKKRLLLPLLACTTFASVNTQAQTAFAEKLDSIVSPTEKRVFTYDGQGNVLSSLYYDRKGNEWALLKSYVYQYDGNGETVHSAYSSRNASTGKMEQLYSDDVTTSSQGNCIVHTTPTTRTISSLDAEAGVATYITCKLGADGGWVETSKRISFYEEGRVVREENYTKVQDEWVGKSKTEQTYSEWGALVLYVSYRWSDAQWLPCNKRSSTYGEDKLPILLSTYEWIDGKWLLTGETTYSYADSQVQKVRMQTYDIQDGTSVLSADQIAEWDAHGNYVLCNQERYENTYDADGQLVRVLCYAGQGDVASWPLVRRAELAYGEDGNAEMLIYAYDRDASSVADGVLIEKHVLTFDHSSDGASHIAEARYYACEDGQWRLAFEHVPCYYSSSNADAKLLDKWSTHALVLRDASRQTLGNVGKGKSVVYELIDGTNTPAYYYESWIEKNAFGGLTFINASFSCDAEKHSYDNREYSSRNTQSTNHRNVLMTEVKEDWNGDKWVITNSLTTDDYTDAFTPLVQTKTYLADGQEQVERFVYNYDFSASVDDICDGNVLNELKCNSIVHYDADGLVADETLYYYSPFAVPASVSSTLAGGATPTQFFDVAGRALLRMRHGIVIVRQGNKTQRRLVRF